MDFVLSSSSWKSKEAKEKITERTKKRQCTGKFSFSVRNLFIDDVSICWCCFIVYVLYLVCFVFWMGSRKRKTKNKMNILTWFIVHFGWMKNFGFFFALIKYGWLKIPSSILLWWIREKAVGGKPKVDGYFYSHADNKNFLVRFWAWIWMKWRENGFTSIVWILQIYAYRANFRIEIFDWPGISWKFTIESYMIFLFINQHRDPFMLQAY